MSIPSPDLQAKIALWREKARNNTLSFEEMKEAVAALRSARSAIPVATGGSKVSRSKPKPNADDLLSELDGL